MRGAVAPGGAEPAGAGSVERAHSRATAASAAAEGAGARVTDREGRPGPAPSLGGGGDAELLVQLDSTTLGAMGRVPLAAHQGLERMVARLATIFVDWHVSVVSGVLEGKGRDEAVPWADAIGLVLIVKVRPSGCQRRALVPWPHVEMGQAWRGGTSDGGTSIDTSGGPEHRRTGGD